MRKISPGLMLCLAFAVTGCGGAGVAGGPAVAETLPIAAAAASLPGDDIADATIKETIDLSKAEWIELEVSPGSPALAPGAKAIGRKQWREARKSLETALAEMQGAPIDQQFAGLALLGRACDFLRDREAAENAYGAILDVWKGEPTVREAIASAGEAPAARSEAVQRVLLAVGEALYFMAEEKRDSVEDVSPPGYTRTPAKAQLRKLFLLAEAQRSYTEVAGLEPAPPP